MKFADLHCYRKESLWDFAVFCLILVSQSPYKFISFEPALFLDHLALETKCGWSYDKQAKKIRFTKKWVLRELWLKTTNIRRGGSLLWNAQYFNCVQNTIYHLTELYISCLGLGFGERVRFIHNDKILFKKFHSQNVLKLPYGTLWKYY